MQLSDKTSAILFLSTAFLISITNCVPITQSGNDSMAMDDEIPTFTDRIYNPDIKTVRFYVNRGYRGAVNEPAVNDIRQAHPFFLEFDELGEEAQYYQAKIIHCDRNWEKSLLQPIEYIDTYNEYDITDYKFSANTKIPYTHYSFAVPRVNLPGNYLLFVYNRDNHSDLALSRRFMIFDNQIQILPSFKLSTGVNERKTHQQADFELNYTGLDIMNPHQEISVVIRQNQRWDNAIYMLKPIYIREIQKELDYRFFNLENNFPGGNEFRFFDLRSIFSPGQNVNKTVVGDYRIDAFLNIDKTRGYQYYGHHEDLNGGYYVENFDSGNNDVEAQYVNVHFFLECDEEISSDIYVFGSLTDWQTLPENKMTYDNEIRGYRCDLLLKQGWYDYIYHTPQAPYILEGSHFETENQYEIFVYHRPMGGKTDILIGYKIIYFRGN